MTKFAAHLLIVDDDERIRTLLQTFLIRQDFMVSTARDASHARRLLEGLAFDMLVLDVMMPVMDGPGFLSALREQCDTAGSLLIFDEVMTGFRVAREGSEG